MRTHTAKKTEKPIFLVNRVHWLCMSRFAAFSTHDWCGEWSFGPWITLTGTSERWIEYGLKLNNSIYLYVCVCMYPSLPHQNVMMMVIIPTLPRSIVRCLCFSTFNICFLAHVVWENWAFFFFQEWIQKFVLRRQQCVMYFCTLGLQIFMYAIRLFCERI